MREEGGGLGLALALGERERSLVWERRRLGRERAVVSPGERGVFGSGEVVTRGGYTGERGGRLGERERWLHEPGERGVFGGGEV